VLLQRAVYRHQHFVTFLVR